MWSTLVPFAALLCVASSQSSTFNSYLSCGSFNSRYLTSGNSVTYYYYASSAYSSVTFSTCSSGPGTEMYIYNGLTSSTSTSVYKRWVTGGCSNNVNKASASFSIYSFASSSSSFSMASNSWFSIRVIATSTGTVSLSINCLGGTTYAPSLSSISCGSTRYGSISSYGSQWYSFTAPSSSSYRYVTISTCNSNFDSTLTVNKGTTTSTSSSSSIRKFYCDDSCGSCGRNVDQEFQVVSYTSSISTYLTGFNSYSIGVRGFGSASGSFQLKVTCSNTQGAGLYSASSTGPTNWTGLIVGVSVGAVVLIVVIVVAAHYCSKQQAANASSSSSAVSAAPVVTTGGTAVAMTTTSSMPAGTAAPVVQPGPTPQYPYYPGQAQSMYGQPMMAPGGQPVYASMQPQYGAPVGGAATGGGAPPSYPYGQPAGGEGVGTAYAPGVNAGGAPAYQPVYPSPQPAAAEPGDAPPAYGTGGPV